MRESRFLQFLCGVLLVPITLIFGGVIWGFVFLAAQSNPDTILGWGAIFIVWLVFVLEGFNQLFFKRRALPWLPSWGASLPLAEWFAFLFFMYAILGLVAYKMVTEPW